MKRRIHIEMCLLLIAFPAFMLAQTKAEKKQQRAQQVKECIEAVNFKIEPNSALTLNGWNIQLTPYYSLEVRNDSVFSYLT